MQSKLKKVLARACSLHLLCSLMHFPASTLFTMFRCLCAIRSFERKNIFLIRKVRKHIAHTVDLEYNRSMYEQKSGTAMDSFVSVLINVL